MTNTIISDDYYDFETYDLLFNTLTDDDREYMVTQKESLGYFLFRRWSTIINSLPSHYYNQYSAKNTMRGRNDWLKTYLDYPTKDLTQMPDVL